MQKIIYICITVQLLYLTPKVESQRRETVDVEFRSVAILQRYPEGKNLCGGTLITKKHIITAKHCIENESRQKIRALFKLFESPTKVSATYLVASWKTNQGIAIIELVDKIYQLNVKPVRLSELKKKQVQGKTATMIGWHDKGMHVLRKTSVKILSDEECSRNIRLITNSLYSIGPEFLCTITDEPNVSLDCRDSGAPILDSNNKLLGVNFGTCPDFQFQWGNFSEDFLQKYRINLHSNTDFYRKFIVKYTKNL